MIKWFVYLFFIVLVMSCSGTRNHKELPQDNRKTEFTEIKHDSLFMAKSFLQLAKNAEQIGDTLGADYYYDKAMEISTILQQNTGSEIDSATQSMIAKISIEYARYLARLNGLEQDTLAAANVMEIINQLEEDTTTAGLDTSVVTMEDVLEENQLLAIPLVLNKKVERAIQYFQTRGRKVFTKWLQRSGWYKDLIKKILKEEGVPEELFYLSMIESGFNPHARSYARAVGVWQFIQSTGRAYGLNNSWWFDERSDPEKATRAAARHLKDLYDRFGNWYLAIAGYNYSPAKIERRMRQYNVDEFWDLPRLPRQTRNYVPTFIAATLIARTPEKYGFYVDPEPPVKYDTVTVNECVDLNVVANCVGSDFEYLKEINPALLKWCTPPDQGTWILNIPENTRDQFLENYAKVPNDQKLTWIHHQIRSGETLSQIARKYGVTVTEIKRFNKIRGSFIRAGHSLVIPVPQNKSYARQLAKVSSPSYSSYTRRRKPVENVPDRDKLVHVVGKGETLWDIAVKYGVYVSQIRQWNGLSSSRIIHPEQRLNIWLPKDAGPLTDHEDQPAPEKLVVNNKTDNSSEGKTVIYTVRSGDTLWDIASRYGVSIRDIKKWNDRRSNLIKPGDELKIITTQ